MTATANDLGTANDFGTANDLGAVLLGAPRRPVVSIERADDPAAHAAYRTLRRRVFVHEQALFERDDRDLQDDDPRTLVLVARDRHGEVVGGVRLGPSAEWAGRDLGWWTGSRLVVDPGHRATGGLGRALVRAACATALDHGVLRFDATVRPQARSLFDQLGWVVTGATEVGGHRHLRATWPVGRFAELAAVTKGPLAGLLAGMHLGGPGFVGDDGAPVPGTDVVAACDAILPSLVERDPEWAGWCGVLVNVNDLSAMGAAPVGLLDAVAGRDVAFVERVLTGVRRAAQAYGLPVLGGHTQLGVHAALAVTALGRTANPVPGGGGRAGQDVTLTADLGGSWRAGQTGRQWDSTTTRSREELATMTSTVARTRPAAAKDVSMAGVVGTLGMLAEAGGTGAVLDVAAVPVPDGVVTGDWLTCFPGFAMLTADQPGRPVADPGPATSAVVGHLTSEPGVVLRWPDGVRTAAVGPVTGLGAA